MRAGTVKGEALFRRRCESDWDYLGAITLKTVSFLCAEQLKGQTRVTYFPR
jgi:hypothetical protein